MTAKQEWHSVEASLRGPFRVAAHVHRAGAAPGDPAPYTGADSFSFVRVRVTDADGVTGDGFTGRFLAAEVAHLLNGAISDALADRSGDVLLSDLMADLARVLNPRGMTGVVVSALSALEVALSDMAGKQAGHSVSALLGGQRGAAPVHVTCGFPALDTDDLVSVCAEEIAMGARGVKVLIAAKGRGPEEDAARLRVVREAIGPKAELIADANCGMDLETALTFCGLVEDLNLTWLEEPVHRNDRHALRQLSERQGIPLGAGQMEQSGERFELLIEAGVDVIQPNAVFAGGLAAAVSAAQAAVTHGRAVSPAGGWDLVNLHWMCGAMQTGAIELHRAQARIVRLLMPDMAQAQDGFQPVPDAPGFGWTPDEDALARCRLS